MNRIFSGIQPTGNLHLGNYLGAIRNWVALQHDYECIFCIVDLHALTQPQDPAELRHSTREVTAAYIAAGIDPEHCIIFNQSMVSAHAELGWLLGCLTPLGWLNRMTQFKEKAGKHRENGRSRPLRLPGADGGRHSRLQGDARPGRRGSEAASGAGPRHRRRVQPALRARFLSAARAADLRRSDPRHEPARRHEEDVEIRHLGLFAHQHDRRRRHDRAQDPPRQDRSRAAARTRSPISKSARRRTISSASMPRSPACRARRRWRGSPDRIFRPSRRRCRRCRSRCSAASAARCAG